MRSTVARSPSASSTSTTGTGCGRRSAPHHSKIAYFAPHDPGYVIDVSGAPCSSRAPIRPRLRSPGLPHPRAGPGDHRPLDQLRVPHRLGRDDRRNRRRRSTSCSPTPSPSPSSATAPRPSPCCSRRDCCDERPRRLVWRGQRAGDRARRRRTARSTAGVGPARGPTPRCTAGRQLAVALVLLRRWSSCSIEAQWRRASPRRRT